MVSLDNFSSVPLTGNISVCERDCRLCSLPMNQVDLSNVCGINLTNYPEIKISRDLFHNQQTAAAIHRDDRRTVLMPVNESVLKRITRTFFEDGLTEALNEAVGQQNAETATVSSTNPIVSTVAKYILGVLEMGQKIRIFFRPHLRDQGLDSIGRYSQTRDWQRSLIRCIRWHPNCFKIAVAANDDSIRVYSEERTIVPILKSSLQRDITSMSWRPFTAAEIAVGCQNGIFLWTLDAKPLSNITRPFTQATHLKHGNHYPVTSLEWNQNGNLLVTCSINDSNILIWNVDLKQNVPLKRVGPPCSILKWSPDGYRLCSMTVGNVFRVWTTDNWQPERWTVPMGSVQSAVWSPCGGYLLFVTTDEPILYSLRFVEEQLFANGSVPKQALPIASLAKITVNNTTIGGRTQSLAWDSNGKHLAITFKDSDVIVIFLTTINRHMMSISPDCFLVGNAGEYPSYICFQEKYRNDNKTILTIGWSSGRVQYFPFV